MLSRKVLWRAGALLLLCLCFVPAGAGAEGLTFADDTGVTVTLPARPEKTAVLFSSFADIWTSAGGTVEVTVGEAVERGFAGEDAALVDAGAGKQIDMETLILSDPDLVIGSADIPAHAEAARVLKEAGIPCGLFRVESFEDYLRVLKIFTEITGNNGAYGTYGENVAQRIRTIREAAAETEEPRKILFIRSGSGASSAKAKTAAEHFAAAMLKELGTRNIAENAPVLLDGLSVEEILREDPWAIFIATMGDETAAKEYMASVLSQPAWQALEAVREGRVFYLSKELFQFKPNARWDEAYRYLAEILAGGE